MKKKKPSPPPLLQCPWSTLLSGSTPWRGTTGSILQSKTTSTLRWVDEWLWVGLGLGLGKHLCKAILLPTLRWVHVWLGERQGGQTRQPCGGWMGDALRALRGLRPGRCLMQIATPPCQPHPPRTPLRTTHPPTHPPAGHLSFCGALRPAATRHVCHPGGWPLGLFGCCWSSQGAWLLVALGCMAAGHHRVHGCCCSSCSSSGRVLD